METGITKSVVKYPLISVIVPVYNAEAYLSDCLNSILGQTYANLEIILVDDGSYDGTGEKADAFGTLYPGRIRVFHKENTGVLDSRIFGTHQAAGEWVGFVDGDDIIEPDMYERLMKNAQEEDADISHCGYQTIVRQGERIHYFYNTGKTCRQDRRKGIDDLVSGRFVEPSVCNKLYKKKLFRKLYETPLIRKRIRYNEDLLMNYLLFSSAEISVYEDFCPYHYMAREHTATRSGASVERIMDPVRVAEFILKDGSNNSDPTVLRKYLSTLISALYGMSLLYPRSGYVTKLRKRLLQYRKKWYLLRKADRLKIPVLLVSPKIYHAMYQLYVRRYQKKIYE